MAAGALLFRVAGPFSRIFRDDRVNFQGDAWYHIRVIEHLVQNFPHRLLFDPYAGPGAPYLGVAPLFDYLVATLAMIAGGGAPSAATIERVAAVVPAVLGATAVLLLYFLASRIFEPRAGLLAAALLAIMPGPFLDRTLLGAADHHGAEVVLVLTTMCLIAAACDAERRHVLGWLAGASLGAYFLTWTAAAFFAAGLGLWAVAQFALNRARSRSSLPLSSLLVSMAAVALTMVILFQQPGLFRYRLQVGALAALLGLGAIIQVSERRRIRGSILIVGAAAVLGVAFVGSVLDLWRAPISEMQDLRRFAPGSLGSTVSEMRPLLSSSGTFSLLEPWNMFRTAFFLGVPGLAVLGVSIVSRSDPGGRALVFVWGALTLAATLGQNRFGYYLAPTLAILTGWICSSCLTWIEARGGTGWRFQAAIVLIVAVVFYPSMRLGIAATRHDDGVPDAWSRSLEWLRRETPEPFGDPDMYFRRYDGAALPTPAYTVMSWWDYGYWIERIGRRVPVSNPTQSAAYDAGRFLTSTTESAAADLLDQPRARYVIVDRDLAFSPGSHAAELRGKFDGVAQWAQRSSTEFFEQMFSRTADGRLAAVFVFYPDYYRTMAVRLSRFDAGAVEPDNSTWVISYADRVSGDGRPFREIVESRLFAGFAAAQTYREGLGDGPHRIVGLDPDRTCVPLPALVRFDLVHAEPADASSPPAVRIFQVTGVDGRPGG
jgi:oligosaccharyl transferase (archaeosortase A-associated)